MNKSAKYKVSNNALAVQNSFWIIYYFGVFVPFVPSLITDDWE